MKKKKLLIVDGQGGGIGRQLVEAVLSAGLEIEITAVGANAAATAAMLKAGAPQAATGENAVVVCARTADCIAGPVGIAIADSLLGEITPRMALAIGQSPARKLLLPVNHCGNIIVGVEDLSLRRLMGETVRLLREWTAESEA
ncbi:MAG: DUF3842 family protein [Clostridia bacterium]|nr:DUF3842 family protein [Clostridia bacterium]